MQVRTPYYEYDGQLLKETLSAVKSAAGRFADAKACPVHVHYAVKANSNPDILRMISASGLGADCVSGGEIKAALDAGFAPEDIVYAGVGKTDNEILFALYHSIGCFNVESIEELEIISEIAAREHQKARIALRINPDVGAHTHMNITTGLAENKFGINMEKLPRALDAARTLPGIELWGIHFHIGSQILDMGDFRALCVRINELLDAFSLRDIRSINVGGGLGVDYEHPELNPIPDFNSYFDTFAQGLDLRPGQELHCELGRSITAQCGSLVTRCIYVKQGTVKRFVIVDAGMNDLIRPALYDACHKIENVTAAEGEQVLYDVVGPICESSDCFARDRYLPEVHRGDILKIRSAGAYGESMASTYNSRPLPVGIIR